MYTLLLLGLLLVCLYFTLWGRTRRARQCLGQLPTYPHLPLIGNMHWFLGGSKVLYHRLVEVSNTIEATQLPFVVWVGPRAAIVLSDPAEAKIVANTFIEKPHYYNFGRDWVGDGLVTGPGEIWKRNVKKIAGSFTRVIVDGYQEVFNVQARNLVETFKTRVGCDPFYAMDDCAFTTLETICQTALGVARISDSIVTEEYYRAFNRTLEFIVQRGLNIIYHADWIYRLTPAYKKMLANIAVMHNVSDTVHHEQVKVDFGYIDVRATYTHITFKVLKKRKIERQKENLKANKSDIDRPFKAFIDVMLDLNEFDPNFTEQQIKSEVATIILGGQETVATTAMMCLLMIGSHSEVQDKLYSELQEIFKDTKRDVTKEDLDRMVYCEAVINETLRLYPPIPAVMRRADKDLELKSCTIPKGTTCVLNAWGAGRSRHAWSEDAASFKPERWTQEALPPLMAFSIGKRACIGKKYALSSLKTMLAYCVRELVFTSDAQKIEFKVDIMLRPISGHLMQVHLRDSSQRNR